VVNPTINRVSLDIGSTSDKANKIEQKIIRPFIKIWLCGNQHSRLTQPKIQIQENPFLKVRVSLYGIARAFDC
jgi:hypothetical protein